MCDTIIATPETTADGVMLFGKNSDREPNEAQQIVFYPAAVHPPGTKVKCTYIEIDQAQETYAVFLSKPFWIRGAEMGVNDQGVAIGNEAIFSKIPASKNPGLIGMDLLRLALERASTASEAIQVITDLIRQFGQGGNCGYTHPFYYHNSFLIADPTEAWVLETVDRHWAAKKITGFYSISNGLTVGNDFDQCSPDLINFAIKKGWCKNQEDFHFARCYSDFLFTKFSYCQSRRNRTMNLLRNSAGRINISTFMSILRDHNSSDDDSFSPDKGLTGASVCMHASFGPIRISQTTGSLVAHLHPKHPTYFTTGTAAPCTSIFKPVWIDAPVASEQNFKGEFDPASIFWRHEQLHRTILKNYRESIQKIITERDQMERELVENSLKIARQSAAEKFAYSQSCAERTNDTEQKWLEMLTSSKQKAHQNFCHRLAWKKWDKQAKMP